MCQMEYIDGSRFVLLMESIRQLLTWLVGNLVMRELIIMGVLLAWGEASDLYSNCIIIINLIKNVPSECYIHVRVYRSPHTLSKLRVLNFLVYLIDVE